VNSTKSRSTAARGEIAVTSVTRFAADNTSVCAAASSGFRSSCSERPIRSRPSMISAACNVSAARPWAVSGRSL
jgi:hypothetical protein